LQTALRAEIKHDCAQAAASRLLSEASSKWTLSICHNICRHLICRHEPLLSNTTNADDVFPDRKKNYTIDGTEYAGVFSVDLTLAEIKTLKARQRVYFRDPNYDDQFEVWLCHQRALLVC
jgi:hypothetical protein